MFGDNERTRALAKFILENMSLEELLEHNDISEDDLVVWLLENGLLYEPQSIIQQYEAYEN